MRLSVMLLSWCARQTCHLAQKLDLKSFFFIWSVQLLFCHWENTLTNYRQTLNCSRSECSRLKVNKYKGCKGILMRRIKQHCWAIKLLNATVTTILETVLIVETFSLKSNNLQRQKGCISKPEVSHLRSVFHECK